MRGADILVKTLSSAGVTRIFSLSGNQIMPIYDACIDARITIVHTRHEASAVFMADAWAQLTGEPGVALVTAAPGFANAMGSLYTARCSESPVVLISGDSPLSEDGHGAFQELDQVAVSAPLTKRSKRILTHQEVAPMVLAALHEARAERPGPIHLAIPFDVVNATGKSAGHEKPLPVGQPSLPPRTVIERIAGALSAAKRPLILTGPALSRTRASDLIGDLERATGAPVLAMESPRGLNDPSLGRVQQALTEADLVLSLGKRIDFTLAFAAPAKIGSEAKWIVAEPEAEVREMAKRNLGARLTEVFEADPRALAAALAANSGVSPESSDWRMRVQELTCERAFEASVQEAGDGSISPFTLLSAVQRRIASSKHSVLVSDGGEFGQWAQAVLQADERLINGPSGAIGGSLCYAIAAAMARPEATVFALMGDGTAGFQFSEFETAARENVPFVAIIGNDSCWNAEHQIQLRNYGPKRLIGCELSDARYDTAAEGLGCHGEYVMEAGDLDAALERAVASRRPACLNVRIVGSPAPSLAAR